MTEAEWLACRKPLVMLTHLTERGRVSDRKWRLLVCACSRNCWGRIRPTNYWRAVVESVENWVDGGADGWAMGAAPLNRQLTERCPVAHSDFFGWSLFRHEDVLRALNNHETFSSAVSQHLSVPNSMDPPRTHGVSAHHRAVLCKSENGCVRTGLPPNC